MVGEAFANLAPATLRPAGKTTFAVNRRNNREADVPMLLAEGDPLKGPVDHAVPVLTVTRPDARSWCGPVRLRLPSRRRSASPSGAATIPASRSWLWRQNHPGATAMFVNTCGGDQNPLPRRNVELCRPEPFQEVDAWLDAFRRFWTPPLDALATELARGRRKDRS